MIDIDSIAAQVKLNCNISDAGYWGSYLPCGLLLRLRDLYRIENRLAPWETARAGEIGAWIGERERLWEKLQDRDFLEIEINGIKYDPFDLKHINSVLSDHGLLYGAGYGENLKPVFILAEIAGHFMIGRYRIFITGKEIARDLSMYPAMLQGNTIIARQETADLFLWDKFEEMKARKCSGTLFRAFSSYGVSEEMKLQHPSGALAKALEQIGRQEISVYIRHEIGEASQRRILGQWWKELLMSLPYSRAELFLRGLKDVLADTCTSGTLPYIIKKRKDGSLHFYVALLGGFRRTIFSGLLPAYELFTKTGDWGIIEQARIEGYKDAGEYVRRLKALFVAGRASRQVIEEELIPAV